MKNRDFVTKKMKLVLSVVYEYIERDVSFQVFFLNEFLIHFGSSFGITHNLQSTAKVE